MRTWKNVHGLWYMFLIVNVRLQKRWHEDYLDVVAYDKLVEWYNVYKRREEWKKQIDIDFLAISWHR